MHLSTLRRAAQHATDLPRHWRALTSRPRLDVVFVTPVRDEAERRRFFADPGNRLQHASGARVSLQGIEAQRRGFNITAAELLTRAGRQLARDLVLQCVDWAQQQGAKVVLLAGATKRLFGRDGAELKARYPELVFATGGNGSAWLLGQDVERALAQAFPQPLHGIAGLRPRTLVVGAYETLGRALSLQLQAAGHPLVGWGADTAALRDWSLQTGLPAIEHVEDLGEFDLLICCAQDAGSTLGAERLQRLRRRRRKLMCIDAAGAGLTSFGVSAADVDASQGTLWRQDAGNACAPGLRHGLGGTPAGLPARGLEGDFAEAIALYHAIYRMRSTTALRRDWFAVNGLNQLIVAEAFADLGLRLPEPHSFGVPQRDWTLSLGLRDPLRAPPVHVEIDVTMPMPLSLGAAKP